MLSLKYNSYSVSVSNDACVMVYKLFTNRASLQYSCLVLEGGRLLVHSTRGNFGQGGSTYLFLSAMGSLMSMQNRHVLSLCPPLKDSITFHTPE